MCELDSDSSDANDFDTYPILLLSYLKKMNHLEGNVQEALFLQNKQHIKELIIANHTQTYNDVFFQVLVLIVISQTLVLRPELLMTHLIQYFLTTLPLFK